MTRQPLVSIVIIFKKENPYLIECLNHCLGLNYNNYEILLLPDEGISVKLTEHIKKYGSKVKVISTGKLNIPKKRNIGIKRSSAEFVAFIDDDAFPRKDWLKNAIPLFSNQKAGGVGGPNFTPPNDPYSRRIAGNVMKSRIAMGDVYIRQKSCPQQFVNDLPTCNLIVRKSLLDEIGFDESLSTGEDAKLCVDIRNSGLKIVYSPNVVVFHHRRRIFLPVMKQLFYYGLYKGKLQRVKQTPYVHFFIPSVFFLFVVFGFIASFFNNTIALAYSTLMAIYFTVILFSAVKNSKFLEIIPTWICIFLVQMSYGAGFTLGFFLK